MYILYALIMFCKLDLKLNCIQYSTNKIKKCTFALPLSKNKNNLL